MTTTFIFDIEANDLLLGVSECWIIGGMIKETREIKYWLNGDLGWMEFLDTVDVIAGHNEVGYDLMVLRKLFNWNPKPTVKIRDTMLMSQFFNYKRFAGDKHSLAAWGEHFEIPKLEFEDFSQFTEEMLTYWKRDIELTDLVYDQVMKEFHLANAKSKNVVNALLAENAVSEFCAMAELSGWPFDKPAAEKLLAEMDAEILTAMEEIEPKLPWKCIAVDKEKGEYPFKTPKWNMSGAYNHHLANWFGIDPLSGQDEDRLVEGNYTRIIFEPMKMSSNTDMKVWLFQMGWVPTEWNYKRDEVTRKMIRMSPKITLDSLEFLAEDGKMYAAYLTTASRASILRNWINGVDAEGNVHGSCFTIGTPSMRARHSGIVNVPSADSVWGKEMRQLFTCKPGEKLVGCDSSGNQARGLAHYLKSEEYVKLLLEGDVHTFNFELLDEVCNKLGISWTDNILDSTDDYPLKKKNVTRLKRFLLKKGASWEEYLKTKRPIAKAIKGAKRAKAKRVLYATLFGAAGLKVCGYVLGHQDKDLGDKIKKGFLKGTPGFADLMDTLNRIYGNTLKTGKGYIPGLGGNKIFCDSPHKLLVYLLQACEKATCGAAIMLTMQRLREEGIPFIPAIMMHDEFQIRVPEMFAERAAEIGVQAFKDGPRLFGITIMDGSASTGFNWYDTH
jgi:DNA polymerase-1